MLFNLILRNVKRNLQVYLIYFLSLSIIYALLYAFNAVPNHPVMGSLSGAKANMTNIFGQYMGILAYVIIMIIIFLVVYSTNSQYTCENSRYHVSIRVHWGIILY